MHRTSSTSNIFRRASFPLSYVDSRIPLSCSMYHVPGLSLAERLDHRRLTVWHHRRMRKSYSHGLARREDALLLLWERPNFNGRRQVTLNQSFPPDKKAVSRDLRITMAGIALAVALIPAAAALVQPAPAAGAYSMK